MITTASKAARLSERVEDECMEVEHLYALVKTTICPEGGSDEAASKVHAMKNLAKAKDALQEAMSWLHQIAIKKRGKVPAFTAWEKT